MTTKDLLDLLAWFENADTHPAVRQLVLAELNRRNVTHRSISDYIVAQGRNA